jgi:hypothetical protein
MGDEGVFFGVVILILGAVIDFVFMEPFFLSLVTATPLTGWNALTTFLFLYGVPYAASCAMAGAIIGAILGAT